MVKIPFNGSIAMTWTVDPLLQEYVNEKLFEIIVKTKIAVVPETAELTKDELNALRYVAGFVPFKLKKKFTKSSNPYTVFKPNE